jgi:hypothetical protein
LRNFIVHAVLCWFFGFSVILFSYSFHRLLLAGMYLSCCVLAIPLLPYFFLLELQCNT